MPRTLIGTVRASLGAAILSVASLSHAGEVSLTGEGSVQYTPDRARLQFTATSEDTSAERASRQVNDKMVAWNQAIADYRAQLDDYSDARLALYTRTLPASDRSEEPQQRAVASQSVSFVVTELSLLNPLLAAAQNLGMEYHLGGQQFFHSDEADLKRQALAAAIADAKAQCQFIAQELAQQCGEVKTLNVNGGGRPIPMMMAEARNGGGAVSEIGPRELQVSVSATFELE
ncbi:SIMPL domain-containing protein [Marinobacter caseinilyticus]|uniref:SIMPL domain-containing protein n=1 Tax=Marinobacter caseinilyticus TaxID=2692195 RepID=UPI0014083F70|nr:SIMPL domain-containing protein [Marinobacter caseinilyticus]